MYKIFILLIRVYQNTLGLVFPPSCRFNPSCSEYSIQALKTFGVSKGTWLSFKRILKCNPFNPGGYDPVLKTHSHNKR
ncbi:MAG: membrane protein insertion efficiency factor YidD [candidate division Zixibacteria bacterium RBG_16_43_9]|nr:MAG: membrane protein insertion efficiency factor YidD [candidate division Zixibacteria bacterium RBG_16_43_9]